MLIALALLALQDPVPVDPAVELAANAEEEDATDTNSRFRPWKKNYFLLAYNPDLSELPSPALGGTNLDVETVFQISIRSAITEDLILDGWNGNIGYTATSFWQMLDTDDSAPFRTTDHSPEIFGETRSLAGHWLMRLAPVQHQSNGESGRHSRSWNRTYAEALWHSDPETLQPRSFAISDLNKIRGTRVALKVWEDWGIDEDNNGDIADYYGHFEVNADLFSDQFGHSALSMMFRNNLQSGSDNKTTVRLEWSFNVSDEMRLLLQFHTGYGLNLLSYDMHQQSIGIGLEISP